MIAEKPDITSLRIDRSDPATVPPRRVPWKYIIPVGALLLIIPAFLSLRGALSTAVEVETTTATLTSPSQANSVLAANGYVVAQRKAAVASKGTGRLVYLGVEEGDKVRKGEIIARLDDQDMVAALAKAKADLQVARADSFGTRNTLDRTRTLFASKLASQADLDAAEAQHLKVRANISSAHASVEQAEVAMEYTRIRAPFDGTVLTKDADVGEVVAPFASSANSRGGSSPWRTWDRSRWRLMSPSRISRASAWVSHAKSRLTRTPTCATGGRCTRSSPRRTAQKPR